MKTQFLKMANTGRFRVKSPLFITLLLLALSTPNLALAAAEIDVGSIEVSTDGSTWLPSVSIQAGSTLHVRVDVTASSAPNQWDSTAWGINDAGTVNVAPSGSCSSAPAPALTTHVYDIPFTIVVPALTADTYDLNLRPSSGNTCGGQTGTIRTLANAVTVTPASVPVAVNDTATVQEDASATPINVRSNDTNAGAATISAVTQPANGVVVNNSTNLTYAPNANYCNNGTPTDNFTYTLSPGGSTATVAVTVTCVDDAPVAVNDSATVGEDSGANAIDVLVNDTDIDGGPRSVASVTQPANGTVVNNGTNLTYAPNANYCNNGTPTDDFTYTLTPGGSTATVAVTVTCVNDAPSFTAHDAMKDEDTGPHANIVVGDGFVPGPANESGQVLLACLVTDIVDADGVLASGPTVDVVGNDCLLSFTQNPDAFGTVTFNLAVRDDGGAPGLDVSPAQQVTITINPVNDAPSFTAHSTSSNEDTGPHTGVKVGDGFSPGPANESGQSLLACVVTNLSDSDGVLASGPTVDVVGSECHMSYTQNPDAFGTVTFDLAVQDSGGTSPGVDASATQPVTITVYAVNDAPSFTAKDAMKDEDTGPHSNIVVGEGFSPGPANESGQSLLACLVTDIVDSDGVLASGPTVDVVGNDCLLSFTQNPDAFGTVTFNLAVRDDGGAPGLDVSPAQQVTITINPVNDAPVANDDDFTKDEDTQLVDSVLEDNGHGVDFDVDADPLTAVLDTDVGHGNLLLSANGAFTYVPDENYCGDDGFTYHLNDGALDSEIATVSITVTCVNDAPVANDDDFTTDEDTQLVGSVLADNGHGVDFDVEADPLTAVLNADVSNGTLVLNTDGSFTYDPTPNYCGPDSFTYHVNDGALDSGTATVSITVTCINDAPVATDDDFTVNEDTQLSGNVITGNNGHGADSDVDIGDTLSIDSSTDVSHGSLTLNADGSFTYDPNGNYCGPDGFTYVITDDSSDPPGPLTSGTAKVSITVTCVNDLPTVTSVVAASQTSDYSDLIGTVTITVNDVDDDLTSLVESDEPPASVSSLSLTSTGCTPIVTESPSEDGSDCTWTYDGQVLDPGDNVYPILFTASDGHGAGTVKGTHTLTIQPEDATVMLDNGNDVAIQVATAGGVSPQFSLFFTAWETNDSSPPFPDAADYAHAGTAADGVFGNALGSMTLLAVGPGSGATVPCTVFGSGGVGYGEWITFECAFTDIAVNTYEVIAEVVGASVTTTYYSGSDEDAFVVYDPSLGFTTAGGWFYWPGTAIDDELNNCNGYPGDKTNFGYVMKYNRKGQKVQGSALLQRHTIDPVTCLDAGAYRVKSNALYGLALGESGGPDNYGWASFAGKATYREPGLDNEGNHLFFIYTEDHGEQGCDQDPSDRLWIEVWDKDDVVVMSLGADAPLDAVNINCGNIYVPHKPGNP